MRDQKAIKSRQGESDRIRVYVRVRPRTFEETKEQESLGVDVESARSEVSLNDSRERRYKFDKIFSPQVSNAEVYNAVGKPLVDAVFSGFNGTLMAYGQTGTGKTHTVMSSDGMCVHVVEKLFKRIKLDKYHDYKVQVSYLQIYQEKIYDLLNINSKVDLVMREDPKKGIYVENLSSFIVHGTADILSLMKQGKKKLIVGETRMNRVSSRSHSIFQITVERTHSTGSNKSATSGVSSASESNLASPSPVKPSLSRRLSSRKSARSTSSLDRLREETTPKRLPPKSGSIGKQSFIPSKTSTPARSDTCRHSMHLTSLPEISLPAPSQPNRWSLIDMSQGFSQTGFSSRSLNSPSDSEGSELQFSMESLLESGTESEQWSGSGSPSILQFEDDDEDESFLEGIKIGEDVLITGRINICDLAGSERIKKTGAEGERLSELQHVNLSLLELGNTIHALSEGKRTHIPYRNSPLTRLLQDSLGGNCKTSFVLCISPLLRDVNETRCTLDFGQRALKITSTAYVNMNIDYMKLSQDLRKRCEIQELEIKSQKENFEKQNDAIKSDAELKLAEIQALLEAERDRHKIEITNLEKEKENLAKALFDERSQRRVIEGIHHASLEAALLVERHRILNNEGNEKTLPQNALDEERRRSWVIEQRIKEEYERALADEHRRAEMVKQLEQERLEKTLQEEKQRLGELEERLQKSPSHERYTQTAAMLEETEFPRMPPGTNQTETLYNVLLAEIMSLQLLYQMQDLSQACGADNPQSRDSGCTEYEDDVIHCVSSTVLEKGGLLLNNLRGRQRGESRFSLRSTDSLRELYFFQFPQSPRLSRDSQKTGSVPIIPVKSSLAELKCESKKSFSSTDSVEACRGRGGSSSSSMESFLDDEPLKLRCRNRPSDSGCSSQQSDYDHSSKGGEVQLSDSAGRIRANTYPAKLCNTSTCVPLAEEEDEDLEDLEFLGDGTERDEIQSVKNKVVHLKNDLCSLKTELDSETVNFFSEVFGVEVPFLREGELSRVMRRLFEGVREKLLHRLCASAENSEITGEDGQDLDLTPPLLEEAVNLLLVNKTVMSCILVLQNRRDSEMIYESTRTELPTVIRAPLKVDRGVQVDLEQVRWLRRRIRKHAGVMTDPPEKIQNSNKECQTSTQEIFNGETKETFPDRDLETSQDPWMCKSQGSLERVLHNSAHLLSRDPDGASVNEDRPAIREANGDHMESEIDNSMGSHLGMDLHEPSGKKKKKATIFSCFCAARPSFRKKTKKASKSKTENNELMKTI